MRNERDDAVLEALDKMKSDAPKMGLCPSTFALLKTEFIRLMGERDGKNYRNMAHGSN